MHLYTKIIPDFKYHINIGYGILLISYRGQEYELTGIGQENKLSGNIC